MLHALTDRLNEVETPISTIRTWISMQAFPITPPKYHQDLRYPPASSSSAPKLFR
jgi:hypothetical protein